MYILDGLEMRLPERPSGVERDIWVQYILVPEVLNLFTMKDLGLTYEEANTLRIESTEQQIAKDLNF
ncbi:MAG: RTC4-like domain [Rhodoferax sp.]|nr:RTC4-like domain [Rhodoferax sp.]